MAVSEADATAGAQTGVATDGGGDPAPGSGAAPADAEGRVAGAGEPLVIRPASKWPSIDLRELWSYRGLFFFLVWRDIKVRYAQTVLGVLWAVLQPVLTMVVFTFVFGNLAEMPSDNVPYPVFSLAALVPWTFFSKSLGGASSSLLASRNLITKVYFPRLVIPAAPVLAGLVDFAIAFVILMLMILGFGGVPSAMAIPVLPVLIVAMMITAGGVGCWLSALNIQYRDVKYVVPFLTQVWMYVSPVIFPLSLVMEKVDEPWVTLYLLNPMVGVIEGFRAVLLGTSAVPWSAIGLSLASGGVLFVTGVVYFRRTERVFADVA